MFVKRITQKINDITVSKTISLCTCCGKPVMGMSKIGQVGSDAPGMICPECLNLNSNDNPENK